MSNSILLVLFTLLLIPGLIGVFLPIIPGLPYMFVVAVVFGLIDGFAHLTGHELLILGLLAVISFVVDHASGLIGARIGGANKRSVVAGLIGAVIGTVILPPFGGIAGLFLGVYGSEMVRHQDSAKATKAAKLSVAGSVAGVAVNAVLAILFIVLFVVYSLH